jgi:hypothetical protein
MAVFYKAYTILKYFDGAPIGDNVLYKSENEGIGLAQIL